MSRRIDNIVLAIAALLLSGTVVVFVVHSFSRDDAAARDPRAYPISVTTVSLDEALRRAAFTLPNCVESGLRYALVDNGFGYYYTILLQLEAPEDCINEFIAVNYLVDLPQHSRLGGAETEKAVSNRSAWMDSKPVRDIGWELGSDKSFQEFSAGNDKGYSMTALAQHLAGTSSVRVYAYASHGG
ncbi:hypothetical protein AB0M46_12920 [Dactylosporangium sp. NPDC051485]|uniref:hypothetical protein n=1 Tax=Dactylosporangium sp. NPDC051485 TaxID=3154846 RepID=UPI0034231785